MNNITLIHILLLFFALTIGIIGCGADEKNKDDNENQGIEQETDQPRATDKEQTSDNGQVTDNEQVTDDKQVTDGEQGTNGEQATDGEQATEDERATDGEHATDEETDAGSQTDSTPPDEVLSTKQVTVRWWGHACFSLTSKDGISVMTDPFPANYGYGSPTAEPDVCLITHEHSDHNAVGNVKGNPIVVRELRGDKEIEGIVFRGVKTFHDTQQGATVGENTVYVWEMDQLRFAHLGDLAHVLTDEQLEQIGAVDVLMTPVGGGRSLNGTKAVTVAQQLKPKVIFPMHYRTPARPLPISANVDDFLQALPSEWVVEKPTETEYTLSKSELSSTETKVVVLPYK